MTSTPMAQSISAIKTAKREEPEWVVVVVVAIALLLGWLLKTSIESRTDAFNGAGVSLSYPAAWLREPNPAEEGLVFQASDLRSGSLFRTNVALRMAAPPANLAASEDKLTSAVTTWTFGRSQVLDNYRILATETAQVGGQPAGRVVYTFVNEPIANPYRWALPVVVEAVDYVFLHQGQVYVLTLAADGNRFEPEQGRFEAIIRSVTLTSQ
ncbi:MAG: hypothetical protein U0401_25390 [Anaerolineae bacterium]